MGAIVDSVSSLYNAAATVLNWNHTINAAANFICLELSADFSTTPISCTVGGVAADLIHSNVLSPATMMWHLVDPPSGVQAVIMTVNTNRALRGSAVSYYGVDVDDPVGTHESATGTGVVSSLVVTAEDGWMVQDVLGLAATPVMGADQVQITRGYAGGASYEEGAAAVTMSWTFANLDYSHIAVPIRALPDFVTRAVEYTIDIWDPEQRMIDSRGHEVPRYKIKPNNWGRLIGLQSTTAEVYASHYDDPTLFYIESVAYDGETDEVQIVTNRGDLPEVLLARLASGSTG